MLRRGRPIQGNPKNALSSRCRPRLWRRPRRGPHRHGDRAPAARYRRLQRAPLTPRPRPADGRAIHLPRPCRTGRSDLVGEVRRQAASAYWPRNRHLPARWRDCASRLGRQRPADQPGRRELDDCRARHRPFGTGAEGEPRQDGQRAWLSDMGGVAQGARRGAAALLASGQGRTAGDRRRRRPRAAGGGHALRRTRAGRNLHRHVPRRRRARSRRGVAARRRTRGARRLCGGRQPSKSAATPTSPPG